MKSIQSKILLVVIAGLMAMTLIICVVGFTMTHEIMHEDADRILGKESQKEAQRINNMLSDVTSSVGVMKHYAAIELDDNPEQLHDPEFRTKYIEKMKTMFGEIAYSTIGAEAMFLRIDPEYSDTKSGFYIGNVTQEEQVEYELTDFSAYFPGESKLDWYNTIVETGKGTWITPYFDKTAGMNLFSYIGPIKSGDEIVGIVGLDVDFSYFLNVVNNIAVYDHGYAILTSEDGGKIYNSPERMFEEDAHEHLTHNVISLSNGMKLELRAAYKDVQKNIRPMLFNIIYAFISVFLIFVVYTIFMTRRIVAPLKQLTRAAEKVFDGVSHADFPTESKDEIGVLARTFESTYEKLKEKTEYINNLAHTDALTGLKNRTAYSEAVTEIDAKIAKGDASFGVLVLDINYLKQANDEYGHDKGNELIIHASKVLSDIFGESSVYRIGGDEFVVILEKGDLDNHVSLISKLDEKCEEYFVVVDGDGNVIPLNVARGVAVFDPETYKIYNDVFNRADIEMYKHKKERKNMTKQKFVD